MVVAVFYPARQWYGATFETRRGCCDNLGGRTPPGQRTPGRCHARGRRLRAVRALRPPADAVARWRFGAYCIPAMCRLFRVGVIVPTVTQGHTTAARQRRGDAGQASGSQGGHGRREHGRTARCHVRRPSLRPPCRATGSDGSRVHGCQLVRVAVVRSDHSLNGCTSAQSSGLGPSDGLRGVAAREGDIGMQARRCREHAESR